MFTQTKTLLGKVIGVLRPLAAVLFTLAVLFFFWGLVKYIYAGPKDKDATKGLLVYGIVALFVMSSAWGLVAFLQNTVGISNTTSSSTPYSSFSR